MNSFRTRSCRARRKATITGIALVAFGLSVTAAPAAAADITACDGKGDCFTLRNLEPEVCKLEKIPEVDPVLSPKVAGCTGIVAGGGNPVVILPGRGNAAGILLGRGNAAGVGVPRCPPACSTGPTFPPPPPGMPVRPGFPDPSSPGPTFPER
jgi:hypothetical protein